MTNKDYRTALDSALKELESLIEQEERLQERMLALRKTVNILSTLCEDAGNNPDWQESASARVMQAIQGSITDDILKVVTASVEPLTTSEIRDELNKLGGSLIEQKNPLATINAVLSRLEEQGKVKPTLKGGRRAWSPTMVPLASLLRPEHAGALRGVTRGLTEEDKTRQKILKKLWDAPENK